MCPAKCYENPTILACLNNLVKFEILNGPQKFLCSLRTSIFLYGVLVAPQMYLAKYYENQTILACLNNLVKFEHLNGPQKFLCGLRTSNFFLVFKWQIQMYPVKIYENPTIRTCLKNFINYESKTPPFSGVWVGHIQSMTYIFSFRIWKYIT